MTDEKLLALAVKLKLGEYNGVDVMDAWIAVRDLVAARLQITALKAENELLKKQLQFAIADQCDTEKRIRDAARTVLPVEQVDEKDGEVIDVIAVAENLAAKIAALEKK